MDAPGPSVDTSRRSTAANIVIGAVIIILLCTTLGALYLEKKNSLRRDLNAAAGAIATSYYNRVCKDPPPSDPKCESEMNKMKLALESSLTEAIYKYEDQLIPQWAPTSLVVGFIGFLIMLLGFKRFESIDSLILGGQRDFRKEMTERLQKAEETIAATVLVKIGEEATGKSAEMWQNLNDSLNSRAGELNDSLNSRAGELLAMQDALRKEFSWLRTDELRDIDPELMKVQSAQGAQETAQQLIANDKPHLAARVLRRIVEEKLPGDADDYFNASNSALNLGNHDLAQRIVEVGLEYSPWNADLQAYLARIAWQRGDTAKADKIFKELAADDSMLVQFWRVAEFYTDFLVGLNKHPDADLLMKRYTELARGGNRDTIHPLLNYALILERRCDVQAAKSMLKDVLERFPNDTGVAFNLARLHMEDGNLSDAQNYVEQALLNSSEVQPSVSLGNILHIRGRIYEALAFAREGDEQDSSLLATALQSYAQLLALGGEAGWHTRLRAKERLLLHGINLDGQEGEPTSLGKQRIA